MAKYYKTCQHCGANLDPGEKCDCSSEGAKDTRRRISKRKSFEWVYDPVARAWFRKEVDRC